MASSRLPDKVLLDIAGEPMLVRVVERARRAKSLDDVIVATTTHLSDDAIAELCAERDYIYYRGSEHDVLDRYFQAANIHHAEVVVRITADCPVIDPDVIDKTVNAFLGFPPGDQAQSLFPYDFAANRLPPPWGRTYPIGLDTEVCTFQGLETAWQEAELPHQREHVMPFFYEQPQRFRILHVTHHPDYGRLRWTVDTADDLELAREIYTRFPGRDDFTWLEILDLYEREPDLAEINKSVQHKDYRETDDRQEELASNT